MSASCLLGILRHMRQLLVVSDFYAPHWTGVSKSIEGLTKEVSKTHPTTVLTVQFDKKLQTQEHDGQVTVRRIPYLSRFSRTYLAPALLWHLLLLVPKHDTILINSPCTYVMPAALVAKLFGKRLVLFHQGDLILPQKTAKNRFLEWAFDVMTHSACLLADQIATYTTDYAATSRIVSRHTAKAIAFIPPLLYPKRARKTSQKTHWQQTVSQKRRSGHLIIGCAGRFVEEKGLDTLFEALIQIRKNTKQRQVHVLYAGASMPYENYLERYRDLLEQLADTITFTGLLHNEALGRFYESIDVFVLPSRSECFGLVQAEALHYDVPLIVSDIPGARHLTRTFYCGQIVAVNNPSKLASAIETFTPTTKIKDGVQEAKRYLESPIHRAALHRFLAL